VRTKLFAQVEGVSAGDHAAGVAVAHSLIEPVLKNLRDRVERLPPRPAQGADAPAPAPARSVLLH
jgi:hypothetical protein